MHICSCLLVWLALFNDVDSKTTGKTPTFKKLKRVSAFGLFRDKKPPTWERGYIVGYSLRSAKGELHFKSKNRKSSTAFPYPSLIDKLYLDKTPKWNQLTVGRTVLVEFQPGKYHTGKIVARTNPSSKRFHRYGGKIVVKISNRKMTFDYRKVRLKGMNVCRYFEVDCDAKLENCQPIYLTKRLLAPAQYKCSCRKGFKRHPTRKCIAVEPTEPPTTEEEVEEQIIVETTGQKEKKSNVGAIVGSLSACLVLIIVVVGIVLRKKFAKRMTSEERLRKQIIEEMEDSWRDEDANIEKQTLWKRILNQLQSFPARLKSYFTGFIERLEEKNSQHKMDKIDSQTAIEKSSSENVPSEAINDTNEALVNKDEN